MNIEEAIKIMNNYKLELKAEINGAEEWANTGYEEEHIEAIETLIKEYERLNKQLEYDKTHILIPQAIKLNYIPKSKIEDKIKKSKELKNEFENDFNKELEKNKNMSEFEKILRERAIATVNRDIYLFENLLKSEDK